MDMHKNEIELVKQADSTATEFAIIEIGQLELAVIGGGSGNEIFA